MSDDEQRREAEAAAQIATLAAQAQDQGWWIERHAQYWLFYPRDTADPPCRVPVTPSDAMLRNFIVVLERAGLRQ